MHQNTDQGVDEDTQKNYTPFMMLPKVCISDGGYGESATVGKWERGWDWTDEKMNQLQEYMMRYGYFFRQDKVSSWTNRNCKSVLK